ADAGRRPGRRPAAGDLLPLPADDRCAGRPGTSSQLPVSHRHQSGPRRGTARGTRGARRSARRRRPRRAAGGGGQWRGRGGGGGRRWARGTHVEVPGEDGGAGRQAAEGSGEVAAAARADVGRAMARLSARERELLWLAYAEGATHREIADVLGLKSGSIKLL